MSVKYNPDMPSTGYNPSDLEALRSSNIPQALVDSQTRFDSADDAALFFARELDYVKAKAYDKQYPKFSALAHFPHTSEVDPGAETVTYYSYDKTGFADIINNYATDLPRADAKGEPTTAFIKSVGVAYGYSVQEMRAARFARKSLDVRKAESARYQIDNALNKIAWAGNAKNKLVGVLSPENDIPRFTISTNAAGNSTKWEDKTADEILNDVNSWAKWVSRTTQDVENPDSLLLPSDVYMDIATRRIPDTETTVLAFLLEKSPYIKSINSAPELNNNSFETNPLTSPEDKKGVAFLYTNDPEKFAIEDPLAFLQHAAQVKNLETVVPCEARTAGALIYYPLSALIIEGVS